MPLAEVIDLHQPVPTLPAKVAQLLQNGAVIAYPTDTIYGLGCDALNPEAVRRLIELKGRPSGKPISILYASVEHLLSDFPNLNSFQVAVIKRLLPGKITIILPLVLPEQFPAEIVATGSVGVRVIDLPPLLPILRNYPHPITTTSVNPAGQPPAKTVSEILSYFGDQISLILDYGKSPAGQPSTVIRLMEREFAVEREGAVPINLIKERLAQL